MRVIVAILVALALAGVGLSYAEPPLAKPDKGDKARERLEIITMWKMMEALNLDRATADKILEIRHKFLAKRKELHADLRKDMEALKQRLGQVTAAEDNELARLVADIRDKRRKLIELWDLQYDEVSKHLTTKQQAELVIFLKEFRKELQGILHPGGRPERPERDPRVMGPHYDPPPPPRPPHGAEQSPLGPDD